jgi:hypothetical protein
MNTTVEYTSNLQKGGALLDVTALLVSNWDVSHSPDANLASVVDIGAASAVRRSDLSDRILRPRYVEPGPHVIAALRVLLDVDRRAFCDACFFETSRAESLLGDFAEGPLFDWYQGGRSTVTVEDAATWLATNVRQGRAPAWSDAVQTRVARALLATLRDFGVLNGAPGSSRKTIGHPYPSIAGFAYVCWRLHDLGVTAASIEQSSVWRRWLLSPTDVGGLLAELAQHGVIVLNRAGSVTRIEWQASTLAEAVHGAA